MKLTKRQLRRIIKEEKAKLLREADHGGGWNGSYGGMVESGHEFMVFLAGVLEDRGYTLDAETWGYIEYGINEIESEAHQKGMNDGQEGHLTEGVGYYDGIPEQHMADEEAITVVAMQIQRSSSMRDQAAVNMAIGIIEELRAIGFRG